MDASGLGVCPWPLSHGRLCGEGPVWVCLSRPGAFHNSFLPVLEAGRSKIKVPTDLVSGEGPPPSLQRAIVSYPYMLGSGR